MSARSFVKSRSKDPTDLRTRRGPKVCLSGDDDKTTRGVVVVEGRERKSERDDSTCIRRHRHHAFALPPLKDGEGHNRFGESDLQRYQVGKKQEDKSVSHRSTGTL
jgi:hypothetical protein